MDEKRQRKLARSVGASIASARERAGLTQEEVSERLGIGNQAVSRIERGAVIPTVARLFELAEVLDCRVDELLLSSSDRGADQALAMARQIDGLSVSDRELVAGIVGQLAQHLRKRPGDRRPRPS